MPSSEYRPINTDSSKRIKDPLYDRVAYKQSLWADTIDAVYRIAVWEGLNNEGKLPKPIQQLTDWANWMVREGHQLSNLEITQRTSDLLAFSDDE